MASINPMSASFVRKVSGKSVKTAASNYLTRNGTQSGPVGTFVKQVTGSSLTKASLARYSANKGTRDSPTASFVKKVSGTSLTSASLAYYRNKKGGYTLQPKRGRTSQKDPVARRLNLYAGKVPDGRWVTHIYAQRSRVMRGTDNLLAVKLNTGEKGWITDKGSFIVEDDVRKMLYSVDQTLAGISEGSALLDLYDSLTVAEKAKVAEAIRDYDWEAFWKEMYPTKGARNVDNQYENYDELVERIAQALGR